MVREMKRMKINDVFGQKVSELSGNALMRRIVIQTEMISRSALSLVMRVWKCDI